MASNKKIKSPPQLLPKEEVLKRLRTNQKFQADLKFAKEVFYPALCKASTSVEDAQMFLSSISSIMMSEFLGLMKERKFGDLKLVDKLDAKSGKYDEIIELLGIFEDKNVFEAKDLIEGMKSEIALFVREENERRPLSDLKAKWID